MEELHQVKQGRVPAPQTLEFFKDTNKKFDNMETSFNELSTNMQLMKKDIQSICEKLDENKEEHKAIMNKIDKFIEAADTRYAEKKIENLIAKIIWAFGFLVVGAIATAVFKLIFI